MGKPWVMFTKEQGQELIDNTTNIWTTINGVIGRKFTNKADSSKYIFLPTAGVYDPDYEPTTYYGKCGRTWSSTLQTSNNSSSTAFHLFIDPQTLLIPWGDRNYGYSIRGIQ